MRSPDTVIAAWPPTAGGPPAGRAAGAAGGALGGPAGSAVVTEFLSRAYRVGYLLGDAKVVDEHHRPEQQRDRHALTMNVEQGAAGFFLHADFRADEGVLAHLEITLPVWLTSYPAPSASLIAADASSARIPVRRTLTSGMSASSAARNPALTWAA